MLSGIAPSAGLTFFVIMGLAGTIGTFVLYQIIDWRVQWELFLDGQKDLVAYKDFLVLLPEAMVMFYILAVIALASPVAIERTGPLFAGRRRRRSRRAR